MGEGAKGLAAPVVVVGEGLNCLGIIRSLAGAGLSVTAVTTPRRSALSCSRLARVVHLPGLEGRPLVEGLKTLGPAWVEPPVLMLGGDRQVAAVSEARAELEPFYRIALPPAEVVHALADKARFQEFALAHGLPVPRTVVLERPEDLARLDELAPPLVLKPADKAQVLIGHAERALKVCGREEARAAAARMAAAAGSIVAQEWIEGGDSDLYFALFVCDRESRLLGLFAGRKLACMPPAVGNTAICAPAGEAAGAVARLAAQFVAEARYRGIGGIEFKRDARTGRFLIVEPTVGRTDWQSEVATLNGINLPLVAVYEALERPLPRGLAPSAARVTGPSSGDDRPTGWRASLFVQRPRDEAAAGLPLRDGYFRLDDPLPGVYHYLVEEIARRLARRLARLARPAGARAPAIERSASSP